MALLNPQFLTSVVPQRPTDDGMGNTTWTGENGVPDLPAVRVAVWLGSPSSAAGQRGPAWQEQAQVYVPRGSDLKSGDRIPYQGLKLVLSGIAVGDQVHPFTGHDFGWMVFSVVGDQ